MDKNSIKNMSDTILKHKLRAAYNAASGWKKCHDGSYERALVGYGFPEYKAECISRQIDWREVLREGI